MKGFTGHASQERGFWKHLVPWLPAPILTVVLWLSCGGILQGAFFLDDYYLLHFYREGISPLAPFFRDFFFGTYFRPGVIPAWGLAFVAFGENAMGHFSFNLLIVLATVLLLYGLAHRLTHSRAVGFFSALLFAALPSTTAGSAFIINRFDIFGTLLFVASLYVLLMQWSRFGWVQMVLVFLLGLWSMLCKENMSTLPAVAALFAWYTESGEEKWQRLRKTFQRTSPLWLAFIVYFVWRTVILKGFGGYQFSEAHLEPLSFLKTFAISSGQSLEYPLTTITLLLGIALFLGWTKRSDVRALAVVTFVALVITFSPMLLGSKGLALFVPLRLFYLSGTVASLFLGVLAWETGRRSVVGKAWLLVLAALLIPQARATAASVAQGLNVAKQAVLQAEKFVREKYPEAPEGSIFYYCDDELEPALDMAVKWRYPKAMDRYYFLRCNDMTQIITRPDLFEMAGEHMPFQEGIRNNPVTYGRILYGNIVTDVKKVRVLAAKRDDVHFMLRGSDGVFREVTTRNEIGRLGER